MIMSGQIQTYRTIADCPSETAGRCLELVRRHAPRLMRCGGGALRASLAPYAKVTEEVRAEVLRLRTEGMSYDDIAAKVGMAYTTVHRICMKAGHAKQSRPPRLSAEVWDHIRAHRIEGKQTAEIARLLGISTAAVAQRLKAMGLSNPPGGRRVKRTA